MSFLFTIIYLVLVAHANASQDLFNDDAAYNPCQTDSGVFFYPNPSDSHQYYQCDESGNAYLRSCGNLVWDAILVSCNWPSAVVPRSPIINTPSSTSPPIFTTTAASSLPTNPWQSSTVDSSSFSLCKPINPCGEHGQCLESRRTVPRSSQLFACICSDGWFGKICDKLIDDLTTPPTFKFDQNTRDVSRTNNTFSLPVLTDKDAKYIFYGLKDGDKTQELSRLRKRTINLNRKRRNYDINYN
jgi:hypothetical protein